MPRWLLLSPSCAWDLVYHWGCQAESVLLYFELLWPVAQFRDNALTMDCAVVGLVVTGGKVEQRSLKLQENESVQTTLNFMKVASFCFEPSRRGKVASFASSKLFMIVFFFSAKFTDMNLCNWLSVFDPISTMINFVLRHAVPKSSTPHDPTNGRGKLKQWSRRCRQTI